MKWLITTKRTIDLKSLLRDLDDLGCDSQACGDPIPLDSGEQVIEIEGPDDVPERAKSKPSILAIHPSSEMEHFD